MGKVLDNMILPKTVQCDQIDLQINVKRTGGWEWAQGFTSEFVQEEFSRDVTSITGS